MALDPTTGAIGGIPSQIGSWTFTVEMQDAAGSFAVRTYTLLVRAQTVAVPAIDPAGIAVLALLLAAFGAVAARLRGHSREPG